MIITQKTDKEVVRAWDISGDKLTISIDKMGEFIYQVSNASWGGMGLEVYDTLSIEKCYKYINLK